MEFAIDLKSQPTVFPRNYKYQAVGPNNVPGLAWEGKYGIVGMDSYGQDGLSDGINEAGLYCGALYLPGFTKYQEVPAGQESKAVSQLVDFVKYILSTCATVDEVKNAISKIYVWNMTVPQMSGNIELHFSLYDANGGSIVVEYINGESKVHDNPIGTLTNSPPFEWHMLNLGNYVNLSAINVPDVKMPDYDIKAIGQGSGLIGLPGDFTPPSRFVRSVAFTQSALEPSTAEDGVITAYHIVNSFDIVKGMVRGKQNDKDFLESTQWSVVVDLKNRKYYIRYYDRPITLMVDLTNTNFESDKIVRLVAKNDPWYVNIANDIK
jgi:choloylglycine hydrolase